MLIDKVTLNIAAGKGGDGVVRWRREKGIPYGGPAGGDGGKGGDVYFLIVRDVQALSDYKSKTDFKAGEGKMGEKRSMHGKDAEDLILRIPVGSVVHNLDYDIKYEFNTEGEKIKILKGGKGGLGNENFKTSTNRTPEEFTKGKLGESARFEIELKLIADAGIIGKPNAGKSSLLNSLTRAGAKVGDYEFTTLEPNLGVYYNYVLADIPGLIEGASEGRGLGVKFLKHIKRTSCLVHLISAEEESLEKTYKIIRDEMGKFDPELLEKKELLVISKSDLIAKEDLDNKINKFCKANKNINVNDIVILSLFDDSSIKAFADKLIKFLENK